ncbi:roadblock/LC7 domain-containing protein [Streptomyces sp. GF20]|uniref:roadblock/LC7 domain-containing protein n=1 Tax=Streptomyces sp. GF20 TaxID=2692235 RepID=UPI0013166665|nr:roadblock/LC7 domain-containing protein [Streptomyces sp. GF20]QHC18998.1 roadblock/LC7 domain-containing protein [Streptomyces sp. GF20]
MNIPPKTSNVTGTSSATAHETTSNAPQESMVWLLQDLVDSVPAITHAVLLSRDGLRLLDSGADRDWTDRFSAGISGVASMAAGIPGPSNKPALAAQVVVEREDCLVFVQSAGSCSVFDNRPGDNRGQVDTVLAVVAEPTADVHAVGFAMGRLVSRFAPYMVVPVRISPGR